MDELIHVRAFDVSPGPPYYPVIKEIGLYRTSEPNVVGKRYYLAILGTGCSRTWISDAEAEAWKAQT